MLSIFEGQYWLGATRDEQDPKNWKWINGKPVSVSFWNLPGGDEDCARLAANKCEKFPLLTE